MNWLWLIALGITIGWGHGVLAQTEVPVSITGTLSTNSDKLKDGSYYAVHTFKGQAGEKIKIDLVSEDFDAYLMLLDPDGKKLGENDDGGEGKNARLVLELPKAGEYQAIINTYGTDGIGLYTFSRQIATEADFQLAEADRLNDQVLALNREGRYQDAIPLAERSLLIREQQLGADHPDTATSLSNLGGLYQSQGHYSEAEPLYKRSLAINEEQLGADHPDTASSLSNLANLYQSQGRYSEAEPLYKRSLSIREQQLGADHPDTATSLNNLAGLYESQGRYSEAEPLYKRSLSIYEQQLGADHPLTATALNNLAYLYQQQGRYSEAEPLYKRSLAINEQQLGADHPDTASGLSNLANLYQSQGRYSEAEPLYKRSLLIREEQLGADHPDTALSLNNLALLYDNMGHYSEAEPLYKRSLSIYEQQLGADHPLTATSLSNLAGLYESQGRYSEAEPLYKRSLSIREQQLGADHPDTALSLNNLALLYQSQGRYSEAEPLYKRSLAINEQQLGADHPLTATSLSNLASLYKSQGRYSEAEPLYKRSLSIREEQLGADHPDTATSLGNLAELYRVQGRYSEAEPLYERSLSIYEQQLGADHPDTASSLNNLASLYDLQGRYSEAELLLKRSLSIREQQLGADHPDTASSLNNLAGLYYSQGRYSEAEPLLIRSLSIWEKQLRADHPTIASSLNNLAELYREQGRYSEAEPLFKRSLSITEEQLGTDHPDTAGSLSNLAGLYKSQGRYSEAEPLYQRSLSILEEQLGADHPYTAISINNLAVLYMAMGRNGDAMDYFGRGVAVEETNLQLNLFLGTQQQRQDYFRTISRSTDRTTSLHLQRLPQDPQAATLALETLLRRKGRILETLAATQAGLAQLDRAGQAQWTSLKTAYGRLSNLILAPRQTALSPAEQAEITQLKAQIKELETTLSRAVPFTPGEAVTVAAVQQNLPPRSVLVEFVRYQPFDPTQPDDQRWGDPRYAAYLLPATGAIQAVDLGAAATIEAKVDFFLQMLRSGETPIEAVKTEAQDMYRVLFAPLQPYLTAAQSLVLSPDGQLNLLPFEALVDDQNRYLIESYPMNYLTTGRDVLRLAQARPSTQPSVVIGDPYFDPALSLSDLSYTTEEVEDIATLLGVSPLIQQSATETAVKKLQHPKILHIATHAEFKPVNPFENPLLGSFLYLTATSKDDGMLTALEASALDLHGTQLVVLSACQTGLGVVSSGEGIYGLRRSLAMAGAESQVISLWQVQDDSAQAFMVNYYETLLSTKTIDRSEALRQTQLAFLQDPTFADFQHPYHWAAFIPSGNWRSMSVE